MTKEEKQFLKAIGVAILAKRNDLSIKQLELAKQVKISRPRLIRIEKGQNVVSLLVLYRICKELELDISDILRKFTK